MFLFLLPAALAGDVALALESDGIESNVRLEGVAPCETMSFAREEAGGRKLRIDVRVEPAGGRDLRVHVGVERSQWAEEHRKLEMRPTLQVRDGQEGRLVFGADGLESTLTVTAEGFDPIQACGSSTVRRTRTEHRSEGER